MSVKNRSLAEQFEGLRARSLLLFDSRETVKTYLRRIYTKAGVNGKQQLISYIDDFE